MNKVLLIEDDRIDQIAFQRFFNRKLPDLQCTFVSSLKEAKKEIQQSSFQFVVIDFNLGDGNAFDFIPQLKNIPFLILSGEMDKGLYNQAKKLGAADFLYKDFNQKYLSTINVLFKKHFLIATDHSTDSPTPIIRQTKEIDKPFNLQKLSILFDGKDHHVREVLIVFKNQNPKDLSLLKKHIKKQDRIAIHDLTHKMKSGYRMLGILDGLQIAEDIENNVMEKYTFPELKNKMDQLNLISQKVTVYIDEILKKEND